MKTVTTERHFRAVEHPPYLPQDHSNVRVIQESSAIGDYDDSMDKPGSSFLWVGRHHHLNREEVAVLRDCLDEWLRSGRLPILERS